MEQPQLQENPLNQSNPSETNYQPQIHSLQQSIQTSQHSFQIVKAIHEINRLKQSLQQTLSNNNNQQLEKTLSNLQELIVQARLKFSQIANFLVYDEQTMNILLSVLSKDQQKQLEQNKYQVVRLLSAEESRNKPDNIKIRALGSLSSIIDYKLMCPSRSDMVLTEVSQWTNDYFETVQTIQLSLHVMWWLPSYLLALYDSEMIRTNTQKTKIFVDNYRKFIMTNGHVHLVSAILRVACWCLHRPSQQVEQNEGDFQRKVKKIFEELFQFVEIFRSNWRGTCMGKIVTEIDFSTATIYLLAYLTVDLLDLLVIIFTVALQYWVNNLKLEFESMRLQTLIYLMLEPRQTGNYPSSDPSTLILQEQSFFTYGQPQFYTVITRDLNRLFLLAKSSTLKALLALKLFLSMVVPLYSVFIFFHNQSDKLDQPLLFKLTWKDWMTLDILIWLGLIFYAFRLIFLVNKSHGGFFASYHQAQTIFTIDISCIDREKGFKSKLQALLMGQFTCTIFSVILLFAFLKLDECSPMMGVFYVLYFVLNLCVDCYGLVIVKRGSSFKKRLIELRESKKDFRREIWHVNSELTQVI